MYSWGVIEILTQPVKHWRLDVFGAQMELRLPRKRFFIYTLIHPSYGDQWRGRHSRPGTFFLNMEHIHMRSVL